jgi:hypothetical protein
VVRFEKYENSENRMRNSSARLIAQLTVAKHVNAMPAQTSYCHGLSLLPDLGSKSYQVFRRLRRNSQKGERIRVIHFQLVRRGEGRPPPRSFGPFSICVLRSPSAPRCAAHFNVRFRWAAASPSHPRTDRRPRFGPFRIPNDLLAVCQAATPTTLDIRLLQTPPTVTDYRNITSNHHPPRVVPYPRSRKTRRFLTLRTLRISRFTTGS